MRFDIQTADNTLENGVIDKEVADYIIRSLNDVIAHPVLQKSRRHYH